MLDGKAARLRKSPDLVVEVAGHTCSVGGASYNQRLSERRTAAFGSSLISQGANPTRLGARGYGMTEPVTSNATEDGRAANRRVELGAVSAPLRRHPNRRVSSSFSASHPGYCRTRSSVAG